MLNALRSLNASTTTMPHSANDLRIGGYQPFSAVDYPGHLAAVIFTQGCPLACPYCHNKALRAARQETVPNTSFDKILEMLTARIALLDAVVFSGGEPLVQSALPKAMRAAADLGFKIGLHTSGNAPERFRNVLPYVDWVGLDVKAPFQRYKSICGADIGDKVLASLRLLVASGIQYEVRTTVTSAMKVSEDLVDIAHTLAKEGAATWVLQEARGSDLTSEKRGHLKEPLLRSALATSFPDFSLRCA